MTIKPTQLMASVTTTAMQTVKSVCVFSVGMPREEASCGCTVATYTKKPVAPGEKGEVKVTYNGKGKFEGHFKKSITVRTNGTVEMTRLYIEGVMTEVKK